ncbi:MAG: hypothetical protein OXP28_13065 [Gammaproteobacteria bacterium]|nr:hypothetical protein [Gammaproteobacteria bacterium]
MSGKNRRGTVHRPETAVRLPFEKKALATAISLVYGATAPVAIAQDDIDDTESGASGRIEEVIVTAQKRSASIQDVPLAIQAFTTDRIDELDISRFEDFALLSPTINIASWIPGTTSMVMRGVSDGGGGGDTAATATL